MFSSPTPESWPAPLRPIAALGGLTLDVVSALGRFGLFFVQAAGYVVIPPFKIGRLIDRIHFIGFRSLIIVILTGSFTGMVLGLQIFLTLSRFGSEAYLGPAVALSLIRELGPVLCAVFVTGLAGSALTAEIGIMKITEQIDALQVMALNPMRYLVSPALVAGVITFPLLTAIFDVVGILGGYLVGVELLGLSPGTYIGEMKTFGTKSDLMTGYWKAISFGIIVPWVCTY
jgi:phospholipid/cholesterol/gamma-HCH transport system permease protein